MQLNKHPILWKCYNLTQAIETLGCGEQNTKTVMQSSALGEEVEKLVDERNALLNRAAFSDRNKQRCEAPNGFNHALNSWSMSDWMTAVVGEVGEAANIIKKLNRVRDGVPGNKETPEELRANLAEEIADAAIYLDLLAQAAGFDLEQIREAKFLKTNRKIGYQEPTLNEHEKRLLAAEKEFEARA